MDTGDTCPPGRKHRLRSRRRSFAAYVIARFTPWHHDGPVLRRCPHRFLCRARDVCGSQFFSLRNVERKSPAHRCAWIIARNFHRNKYQDETFNSRVGQHAFIRLPRLLSAIFYFYTFATYRCVARLLLWIAVNCIIIFRQLSLKKMFRFPTREK